MRNHLNLIVCVIAVPVLIFGMLFGLPAQIGASSPERPVSPPSSRLAMHLSRGAALAGPALSLPLSLKEPANHPLLALQVMTETATLIATANVSETVQAQQTAQARSTAGAPASATPQPQLTSEAKTAEAKNTVIEAEHARQTENAQEIAAKTQTAEANASPTPTPTAPPTPTVTPSVRPAPSVVPTTAGVVLPTPVPPPDKIDVLGLTLPFSWREAGIALGGGLALLALLGLAVVGTLALIRRPATSVLPSMEVGGFTPRLELVGAPGRIFPLPKSPATIGRDGKQTVKIDDSFADFETVSRQHARIERRENRWVLIDGARPGQVSANGVFVNGKRTRENYLKDGDHLRFGRVEFVFRLVRQG